MFVCNRCNWRASFDSAVCLQSDLQCQLWLALLACCVCRCSCTFQQNLDLQFELNLTKRAHKHNCDSARMRFHCMFHVIYDVYNPMYRYHLNGQSAQSAIANLCLLTWATPPRDPKTSLHSL